MAFTLSLSAPSTCRSLLLGALTLLLSGSSALAEAPTAWQTLQQSYPFTNREDFSSVARRVLSPKDPTAATQTFQYDAELVTMTAGLESRDYPRKGQWQNVALPLPAEASGEGFYTRNVPAYFRQGTRGTRRLFVLFGSSYSTWKFGSWHSKTIALLDELYGQPDILAFSGFLTPEFLTLGNPYPDIRQDRVARDLYARIRAFLKTRYGTQLTALRPGLVGYSGGATLVLQTLAQDARQSTPLFTGGSLAASPILHAATAFENLDRAADEAVRTGTPEREGLTTPLSMMDFLFHGIPSSASVLRASRNNEISSTTTRSLVGKFRNEFLVVDLRTVAASSSGNGFHWQWGRISPEQSARGLGNRYVHFYKDFIYNKIYRAQVPGAANLSFEAFADLRPAFASIQQPAYVVFAEDDPVLSNANYAHDGRFPAPIAEVIRDSAQNPNLHFFVPRFGGHVGYALDTSWYRALLRTVLGE
jgi:hypothetical protein